MQTTAIRTVAYSLPENEAILLTLLISNRYILFAELRNIYLTVLLCAKKERTDVKSGAWLGWREGFPVPPRHPTFARPLADLCPAGGMPVPARGRRCTRCGAKYVAHGHTTYAGNAYL